MTKYSFIVLYLILIKEVFDSELYYKKVYLDVKVKLIINQLLYTTWLVLSNL